jgi:hypothetical protein
VKWFKHMTDASADEFIAALDHRFGDWGIVRWWRLLETVAAQMDETDRCHAEYPMKKWKLFLKGSPEKLQLFFNFLQENRKLSYNFLPTSCNLSSEKLEGFWRIEIPKLLELRDNHTRNLQAGGGKRLTSKEVEVEVEVDLDKQSATKPDPLSAEPTGPTGPNNPVENHAEKLARDPFWAEWDEIRTAYEIAYRPDPTRPWFKPDHVTRLRKVLEVYQPKTLCEMVAAERQTRPDVVRHFGWFVAVFEDLATKNRERVTA